MQKRTASWDGHELLTTAVHYAPSSWPPQPAACLSAPSLPNPYPLTLSSPAPRDLRCSPTLISESSRHWSHPKEDRSEISAECKGGTEQGTTSPQNCSPVKTRGTSLCLQERLTPTKETQLRLDATDSDCDGTPGGGKQTCQGWRPVPQGDEATRAGASLPAKQN